MNYMRTKERRHIPKSPYKLTAIACLVHFVIISFVYDCTLGDRRFLMARWYINSHSTVCRSCQFAREQLWIWTCVGESNSDTRVRFRLVRMSRNIPQSDAKHSQQWYMVPFGG